MSMSVSDERGAVEYWKHMRRAQASNEVWQEVDRMVRNVQKQLKKRGVNRMVRVVQKQLEKVTRALALALSLCFCLGV
eukprot:775136-Rhodomonas_salina.1